MSWLRSYKKHNKSRSDGEKCYENWKDGKKCNSELHTDLPESLSAKLTLKEFEETCSNEPDRVDLPERLSKKNGIPDGSWRYKK